MTGDEQQRLFVALELPAEARRALAGWAGVELAGGGRLVPEDMLHVTVAFLGRRPVGDVQGVIDVTRECAASSAPFTLEVDRYRETRSVGMLVLRDPSGAAARLAESVHQRLEELGLYRREARRWLPHVTVLRFRTPPRLRPTSTPGLEVVPSGVAAYLSRLHPSGSRYEVLDLTPLEGPG